jgi:ATP-binding cassette subfamily B protein
MYPQFDFMRCCFPILSYAIFKLSSEINVRSTIFQQYLSKVSSFFARDIFWNPCNKAYSLENQHQNKHGYLANESKVKA